jgi:hypothetical protein
VLICLNTNLSRGGLTTHMVVRTSFPIGLPSGPLPAVEGPKSSSAYPIIVPPQFHAMSAAPIPFWKKPSRSNPSSVPRPPGVCQNDETVSRAYSFERRTTNAEEDGNEYQQMGRELGIAFRFFCMRTK